jgi:hypothetical protein
VIGQLSPSIAARLIVAGGAQVIALITGLGGYGGVVVAADAEATPAIPARPSAKRNVGRNEVERDMTLIRGSGRQGVAVPARGVGKA